MVVLVFIKDSHLAFVKSLLCPTLWYLTTMVPGPPAWNPKETGTKMVTVGSV